MNQPRASFLQLPAELRNQIYQLALAAEPNIIHLTLVRSQKSGTLRLGLRHTHEGPRVHTVRSLTPDILSTCRQINREATPILYGSNIISIEVDTFVNLLQMFLTQIGYRARFLRHIAFYGVRSKCSIDRKALKNLSGLRKVSVWIHGGQSVACEIESLAEGLLPVVRLLLLNWSEDEKSVREVLGINVIVKPKSRREKRYCSWIPDKEVVDSVFALIEKSLSSRR